MPARGSQEQSGSESERTRLVAVAEAAAITGLSESAVYRAIASGELRASKLRGRLRVRFADIDLWIDSNAVRPSPTNQDVDRPRDRPFAVARPALTSQRRGRGLRELLQSET
jgi:excisionase family DNA binding protein